jgi:hypothetical protein
MRQRQTPVSGEVLRVHVGVNREAIPPHLLNTWTITPLSLVISHMLQVHVCERGTFYLHERCEPFIQHIVPGNSVWPGKDLGGLLRGEHGHIRPQHVCCELIPAFERVRLKGIGEFTYRLMTVPQAIGNLVSTGCHKQGAEALGFSFVE